MTHSRSAASARYVPRLIVSWLTVGALLAYGVAQAVIASLPLFVN